METQPESSSPPPRPAAPYPGFRVVFAVVNAFIFFLLASVISTPVALGLAARGGPSARALFWGAATVAFFACFFGLPGAIGGFLDSARKQRFVVPPVERWGRGLLSWVWIDGAVRGLVAALLSGTLVMLFPPSEPISRLQFPLALGGFAAVAAFAQSLLSSGPRLLGDLRPAGPPLAPQRAYFFTRFALPQGFGNAFITALIAAAVLPPDGAPAADRASAIIGGGVDAAITTLVIAMFMIFSAGGLAKTDRAAGRVAGIDGSPPSLGRRFGIVLASASIAAVVGAGVGALGLPREGIVAWKFVLGAIVGGATAALAARHALREKYLA